MADKEINKETNNTIDMHYQMMDTASSTSIIQKAMDLAREEIPKGAVATYIPELSKADPHQLGICVYPLKGEKICLGDYDVRFTMQSVSRLVIPVFLISMLLILLSLLSIISEVSVSLNIRPSLSILFIL